jgi:hypothetical protein
MPLNTKHIKVHNGKREYTGEETSNLVIGQEGIDVLVAQNDLVTAGGAATIGGVLKTTAMEDVKGWISITSLGDNDAIEVTCIVQFKRGFSTYTNIALSLPLGATIYGPFYMIKLTDTVVNNEALYCVRG